jgi:GT2 family glycosyltransferase
VKINQYKLPKIVVVIPTFNRINNLEKIIRQLKHQKGSNFQLYIVIVVDGSTDGTNLMLRSKFPKVIVVKGNGQWWFTKSLNEGFKFADTLTPDFVLVLNDDTEIDNNYIANLLVEYKKINQKAIIGSISVTKEKPHKITYAGMEKISWWRIKRYSYPLVHMHEIDGANSLKLTKTLTARGTFVPFSILKELNYFDEISFPQYGSDDDFALKANRNGIPVFISSACILYDNTELTGKGSPRLKPSFQEYTKQMFNRYSPVYIMLNIILAWRYGCKVLIPVSTIFAILTTVYRFTKYKKL